MSFPEPLRSKWHTALQELYRENTPAPPPEPPPNTLEHARWRDTINNWQEPDTALMEAAGVELLTLFHEHLPPLTEGAGTTVSLIAAMRNKGRLVDKMLQCIAKAYPKTFEQCVRNHLKLNGDKPLVWPSEYKGDPLLYLDHTPLLPPFFTWVPFDMPREQRFRGVWCVGPSGSGKTTLLHSMISRDIQTDAAVIIIDSKSTGEPLREPYTNMLSDRLVVIEPSPNLALNPFQIGPKRPEATRTLELIGYVISGLLGTEMTPKQSVLFTAIAGAALHHPNPTIKTLEDILVNGVPPEVKLPDRLRNFFDTQFIPTKGKGKSDYSATVGELQWRLQNLLLKYPIFEGMFSAPTTKLDLAEEINKGSIIVIDANEDILGTEGTCFYQRFFLALILDAAQRGTHRPCFVYIDECQSAIAEDTKITQILEQCRAARISMTLAHQGLYQITNLKVRSALHNCAIKYANSDEDAARLAITMRSTAENLSSLPVGTFAVHCRDVGAFNLRVPQVPWPPQMTAAQRAAHRQDMQRYYTSYEPPPEKPKGLLGGLLGKNHHVSETSPLAQQPKHTWTEFAKETHSKPEEKSGDAEMKRSKDW